MCGLARLRNVFAINEDEDGFGPKQMARASSVLNPPRNMGSMVISVSNAMMP